MSGRKKSTATTKRTGEPAPAPLIPALDGPRPSATQTRGHLSAQKRPARQRVPGFRAQSPIAATAQKPG